jgi:hypothetical protein
VSFLVYSAVVERRSVALTIDGGGLTTLREGDEAQGIQVVQHPARPRRSPLAGRDVHARSPELGDRLKTPS